MSEPADLQFDHATYDAPKAGVVCGMCGKPVEGEYWQWLGRVACASCRDQVGRLEERAASPEVFAKAAALAMGTAVVCGLGYAVFVWVAKVQFALVTIGIAYAVAAVIRKSTGNVSGRSYQVMAVLLTYAASTMGYAPYFLRGELPSAAQTIALLPYVLVAPFMAAREAPIGLLIVGFGLWEAWRRTKPLPLVVTGPFRVRPRPEVSPVFTPGSGGPLP